MRQIGMAAILLGLILAGCNKPPKQPVADTPEMDAGATGEQSALTDVRPVEGAQENEGAAPPTLSQASQGRPYVVQKGDTYWNIAQRMLGNGQRWRDIESMNPGVERTKLKVGQTIQIPAQ